MVTSPECVPANRSFTLTGRPFPGVLSSYPSSTRFSVKRARLPISIGPGTSWPCLSWSIRTKILMVGIFQYPTDPLHPAMPGSGRKKEGERGRFSRRLQLGPGLVPPSSWSLSPCIGPQPSSAQSRRKVQVGARFISHLADLREILRSGVALPP